MKLSPRLIRSFFLLFSVASSFPVPGASAFDVPSRDLLVQSIVGRWQKAMPIPEARLPELKALHCVAYSALSDFSEIQWIDYSSREWTGSDGATSIPFETFRLDENGEVVKSYGVKQAIAFRNAKNDLTLQTESSRGTFAAIFRRETSGTWVGMWAQSSQAPQSNAEAAPAPYQDSALSQVMICSRVKSELLRSGG